MSTASPLRQQIEREAEMQDIDLDAINQIESDSPGTTVRILLEDAEDESDQVGFQVTKPPGQMGEQMFSDRLEDGMRKLARLARGEDPQPEPDERPNPTESIDSDDPTESDRPTRSDESTTMERQPMSEKPSSKKVPLETFDFTVSMDDESLDGVREQLTAALEAYDERSVDAEDVAELEARIDDVESRVSDLESTLSMLGQFGDSNDE